MGAIFDEIARDVCDDQLPHSRHSQRDTLEHLRALLLDGFAGLPQLSVDWLRLGITVERIRPKSLQES